MAKVMKRCSASLVIRDMWCQSTLRFRLFPVGVATIKKINNNHAGKDVGKRNTHRLMLEYKLVQELRKSVWRSPPTPNKWSDEMPQRQRHSRPRMIEFGPWDPHGEGKNLFWKLFSDLHTCTEVHAHPCIRNTYIIRLETNKTKSQLKKSPP